MAQHPSTSDWKKYEEVINAGTSGWNPLQRLPVLLEKEYDWMGKFNLGFCSEDDLSHWRSLGWEHLMTEYFEIDNFNNAISLRFGLVDAGGCIKWRDNYLMIQPKDFRKRVLAARNEEHERQFESAAAQQGGAHNTDPRYDEMQKGSGGTLESKRVQSVPKKAKPRGRPPKK